MTKYKITPSKKSFLQRLVEHREAIVKTKIQDKKNMLQLQVLDRDVWLDEEDPYPPRETHAGNVEKFNWKYVKESLRELIV